MKMPLLTLALSAALPSQILPLPSGATLEVGKRDWVVPCATNLPVTFMTSTASDRILDPSYPGTAPAYSVRPGGSLYLRAVQHGTCPGYLTSGLVPFFVFGPRTGVFASLAGIPGFQFGQTTLYNSAPGLIGVYRAQLSSPWEADPTVQSWGFRVTLPNVPALIGQSWAAQSLFITAATSTLNLGTSHYTRIL